MPSPFMFNRRQPMGLAPWDYRVPRPELPPRASDVAREAVNRVLDVSPPRSPPMGLIGNRADEGASGRIDRIDEQRNDPRLDPRAARFDMPTEVAFGLGMFPGIGTGTMLARGLNALLGPNAVIGGPVAPVPGTPMFAATVLAGREAERRNEAERAAREGDAAWSSLNARAAPQTRTALGPSLSDGGGGLMDQAIARDSGAGAIEAGTGFRATTTSGDEGGGGGTTSTSRTSGGEIEAGTGFRSRTDSGGGDESRDRDGGGSSGGVGCFSAGTLVLMANGTEKPIEAVQEGEMVMAFPEGEPETGKLHPAKVLNTLVHENCPTLDLDIYNLGIIRTTPAHRFVAPGEPGCWVPAGDLSAGAAVVRASGGTSVVLRTNAGPRETVYNLTVEGLHTYVANGVRVHNIKHAGGPILESRVPGKTGADVPETLQEGEHVMSREAVSMAGHMLFNWLNWAAQQQGR